MRVGHQCAAPARFAIDVSFGPQQRHRMPCRKRARSRTLSFIAVERPVYRSRTRLCGKLDFVALGTRPLSTSQKLPSRADRTRLDDTRARPRSRSAHKGSYGYLLVVGGDAGMAGAARMACEAACVPAPGRQPGHARQPRLDRGGAAASCPTASSPRRSRGLIDKADVIAIGPGSGRAMGVCMLGRGTRYRQGPG